eukprot:3254747-Pleurochrysis_carterae.AAC.1
MASKSASRRGRSQRTRRSRSTAIWLNVAKLPFNAMQVIDGSVDAIDGEMAKASVNKIFDLPNLPPRTLDRVILAGHRLHERVRSERDGVVRGVLADADLVVIWKYKAQL